MKIYIESGHDGVEEGAIIGEVREKIINKQIAEKICIILKGLGYIVMLGEGSTKSVRVDQANSLEYDLFVSVHCNSFKNNKVDGIETYSRKSGKKAYKLAQHIQEKLIENTQAVDRGVKLEDFFILRSTNMPSVLVECGFLSNFFEREILKRLDYQWVLADSIATGIINYMKEV